MREAENATILLESPASEVVEAGDHSRSRSPESNLKRLAYAGLFVIAAILAELFVPPSHAATEACRLSTKPNIIARQGDGHAPDSSLLQFWDVERPHLLWSKAASPSKSYRRYRSEVRKIGFNTDPLAALRASPSINNDVVLSSATEWIRPANCLEKLLMGLQNDRVSIGRDPTEFVSIALSRSESERVRVYFYSVNRNGIGAMTPLTRLVEADLQQGWRVQFVLHNHAFHLSDPALNGILAPSGPDANFNVNFARSHNLPEARITNGIDTVVIPAAAFDQFERE